MNVDFTSKTREALQKPLYQRCEEIEKLIEGSSTQNLHGFFPLLLSNIFGYSGSTDWGLKTLSRDSREFAIVRRFLSPGGTVFKLIDLLQADDQHRYEFFISCLPLPTQNSLSEGIVPVLYHNKVPIRGPGETVNAVLLNTFEYYMFHFAYYIVHQQANREFSTGSTQDYLYLFVLEDYLNFFLRADGSSMSSSSLKGKATMRKGPSSWHDPSHYPRSQHFQNQFKGLIKPSSGRVSPPTVHHGMFHHGSQEMWRSETFLQILIEFWLNQNTVYSISSNVLSRGRDYFMPSLDHVRVVRILVKHVHSFVYTKGPDMNHLSILHPSDELRRVIVPQFLQKKLYHFLHHCFSHWPLDPSFRYVLETWLSYIQPWRYSKVHGSVSHGADVEADSRETASPEWKFFIFENLLFYSTLLFEFVSRACRFNLYSAKDAQLLFRVIKVFGQAHLVDMIEEGENAYLAPSGNRHNTPQTSLTGTPSSAIKAHIMELEGPSFSLKSVFQFPGATKLSELHARVLSALDEATSKSQSAQQSVEDTEGFFAVFMKALNSGTSQGTDFGRNNEEGKLVSYLEQTNKLLSNIVKTTDSVDGGILNRTIQWEKSSPVIENRHRPLTGAQASLPDYVETDEGVVPTPLGRYQMMNGLRKFEVKYTGDPELQPIRSFENPALVRLLYKLSTHVNKKFGKSLEETYATSRLFRSIAFFLSPDLKSASLPTPSRQPSPSSPHSPQKQMQPQISLRFLACYRTLFYLFIFWIFCKVTSLNSVLVILLWILILVVMLLYHLTLPHQKSVSYSK